MGREKDISNVSLEDILEGADNVRYQDELNKRILSMETKLNLHAKGKSVLSDDDIKQLLDDAYLVHTSSYGSKTLDLAMLSCKECPSEYITTVISGYAKQLDQETNRFAKLNESYYMRGHGVKAFDSDGTSVEEQMAYDEKCSNDINDCMSAMIDADRSLHEMITCIPSDTWKRLSVESYNSVTDIKEIMDASKRNLTVTLSDCVGDNVDAFRSVDEEYLTVWNSIFKECETYRNVAMQEKVVEGMKAGMEAAMNPLQAWQDLTK